MIYATIALLIIVIILFWWTLRESKAREAWRQQKLEDMAAKRRRIAERKAAKAEDAADTSAKSED